MGFWGSGGCRSGGSFPVASASALATVEDLQDRRPPDAQSGILAILRVLTGFGGPKHPFLGSKSGHFGVLRGSGIPWRDGPIGPGIPGPTGILPPGGPKTLRTLPKWSKSGPKWGQKGSKMTPFWVHFSDILGSGDPLEGGVPPVQTPSITYGNTGGLYRNPPLLEGSQGPPKGVKIDHFRTPKRVQNVYNYL